jgi:hypothetical protein
MERDLAKNDARQGNNRRFQWRTLWVSTFAAAAFLFIAYFLFLALTP